MTTTNTAPAAPRVSSTSLPVRTDVAAGTAPATAAQVAPADGAVAPPAPPARRPRAPRPAGPAVLARAVSEPDPEVLEELGRLLWASVTESGGGVEAAVTGLMGRLKAAKRLGEIATLLGVE